jgi:hypothetical protein
MSILTDVTAVINKLGFPVETGVFSDVAPDDYIVITPLADNLMAFADDMPDYETQEVRLSIFSKNNFIEMKNRITQLLLLTGFTINDRRYIGHDDDSKYHHYSIDITKLYKF